MNEKNQSFADTVIGEVDCALRSLFGTDEPPKPAPQEQLSNAEADRSAALMRINMAGELAAQGLYRGQALLARNPHTREHLLEAAQEEQQHLQWCRERLQQLGAAPSLFNPFWYGGAVLTGLLAATAGDRWSLGFVAETEKQVEQHLDEQIERLPPTDAESRRLLTQMREDEIRHGAEAVQAGGSPLPAPIPPLMTAAANLMRWVAGRI